MERKRTRISLRRIYVDESRCEYCGFCSDVNVCRSPGACVGCLSCYWACPYEARVAREELLDVDIVEITLDGVRYEVPSGITIARALELIGFRFSDPSTKKPSLACRTGGCWSCALVIDGEYERTCVNPVRDGMKISTDVEKEIPKRIIHGPSPHTVGGKATPWWEVDYRSYVEAAIWAAGCNLRCPQCQNYSVTYDNTSPARTPREAAESLALCQRRYSTKGVAISGGEPTINRRWLVEFFREITKLVPESVRKHLDSNGTILTEDYVDELVEAGCNNIGIEPKCVRLDTYMKITGLTDRELARRYLNNSWRIAEYIWNEYSDKVYLGIGLVYNSSLISLDEIADAGDRIASIDPRIQVTVLDYFPTFRRRSIRRPTTKEMLEVKKILEERGLRTVIVQTKSGHIGPGDLRRGRSIREELYNFKIS